MRAPVHREGRDERHEAGLAEGLHQRFGLLERRQVDLGDAAVAQRRRDRDEQILVRIADRPEAQRVEIGIALGDRMVEGQGQPGPAHAGARPQHQQFARRRAMRREQPVPVEPVEQAGPHRAIELSRRVARDIRQILEQRNLGHGPS